MCPFYDDREKLVHTKGSRVDGTCEWIKNNALYNSWLCSNSQLLWLSGGPGKGKTMLSMFLSEELERTAKLSQHTLFLQYFCDNKDEKRNTAVTVIRGLVFQLLELRPQLSVHILPSFKIKKDSLFTRSSFETLWRIFENMIRDIVPDTIYCILDGLDECDEASLEVLLKKFRALLSAKSNESLACHLNLIVVSRDLPEFIPEVLSSFPRIQLDPDADTEVKGDIDRFIEAKVDELSEYRQYPEPLSEHVKKAFRDRAQGAFLWVEMVANALRKYKATEVERALDLFPSGLEELYARILLQIDVDRREIAAKILRWVVMAVRPLNLSELSIAIGTSVGPSIAAFSRDELIRDQVSYCGCLLTIKEDEVGLIHQSAKDYLLRGTPDANSVLEAFRVKEGVVNLEIARKCLDYLQNGALLDGKVDLRKDAVHLKAFPFLSYAALHWPEHAKFLPRSEGIFDLSAAFYNKKSRVRISWLKTYWAMKEHNDPPNSFTILHLASYFGIIPLAENLLLKYGKLNKVKRSLYLDAEDSWGSTALDWAARRGHEAMVRLLLEKGANFEAKDQFGSTVLHLAAGAGHEAVVRLLLERGAAVDVKDQYRRTALNLAARGGYEAIVRLLLEKGATFEVKDQFGRTALHWAARGGYEAMALLLLEKGATFDAKDQFGLTVLHSAAGGGCEAIVRLLLEKGATTEGQDQCGETALHFAAQGGYKAIVRLLLEKGAEIEAKNGLGETALHLAARNGHEGIIQPLLEIGVAVKAKTGYGKTALHLAAMYGHEAVVQLLTNLKS